MTRSFGGVKMGQSNDYPDSKIRDNIEPNENMKFVAGVISAIIGGILIFNALGPMLNAFYGVDAMLQNLEALLQPWVIIIILVGASFGMFLGLKARLIWEWITVGKAGFILNLLSLIALGLCAFLYNYYL